MKKVPNMLVLLGVLATVCGLATAIGLEANLERSNFTSFLDHFAPAGERVQIQMVRIHTNIII